MLHGQISKSVNCTKSLATFASSSSWVGKDKILQQEEKNRKTKRFFRSTKSKSHGAHPDKCTHTGACVAVASIYAAALSRACPCKHALVLSKLSQVR